MRILLFASDEFAIPSLKLLTHSKHKMMGVVTQPDKPAGRGQKLTSCPVAKLAKELGLKLLQPATLQSDEAIQQLLSLKPDVLVVVAYGKFLPKRLMEGTLFKAVNLHPSLLPRYRGAAPIQWAILNGDAKTGVTTMTVAEEMDAGDIYLQSETVIGENEDALALSNRLSLLGADLLLKTIEGFEKENLKPKPQDPGQVILAPKLKKEDGRLKWEASALELHRQVRALNPWPGTFCHWNDKIVKIFKSVVVRENKGAKPGSVANNKEGLVVACGQGALGLLEVQLEGKKRMASQEFLKGHWMPTGTILK